MTAEEILFRSDHICCICRVRGKDVQIHHIDGNPRNDAHDNLAVVCLDCHSKVTGGAGLGRSYTAGEVRRYKRSWELQVLDTRKVHRPQIAHKKELVSQIDLVICEILACRPTNPRASELLDMLFELHLWRGSAAVDGAIIQGLHHLALMTGLQTSKLAPLVAEKLWEMCFHYVGPEKVPMGKRGQAQVAECIEALDTLASFNCEFGHGRKATAAIAKYAEEFFEISLWYSKKELANQVLKLYVGAVQSCAAEGKLEYPYGRSVLMRSLRKLRALLKEEQPSWKFQNRRIEEVLKKAAALSVKKG